MELVQDVPELSVKFMKSLFVRPWQMNEMVVEMEPKRGGLRELFRDWRKDFEDANTAEAERWSKLSADEREAANTNNFI